ncbi:release factor glutamine methyltransferase [Clostridiales bacterium]|nr:release factor glutamine methyltransferase [Clostridiales bacterium]
MDTARENAVLNMTEDRTKFFLGNIFDGLPLQKYDIIVSNPPYIRTNEINGLMEDVREFEPHSALNGGDDGLDFYREIASKGSLLLNQNGCIFFEIGYDQSADVAYILEKNGFENIRIIKDLSGLDRVVAASKEDIDV